MKYNKFLSFNYDRLKKLKINDVIYECSGGNNIKLKVVKLPDEDYNEVLETNQLKWVCVDKDNVEQKYLITEGLEHYGPRIYSYPAYINNF